MLEYLKSCKPNFIYEYQGFMNKKGLSGEAYWKVLNDSIFIPVL